MKLFFKSFDSKMASREKLFKAAVEYANQLGRERIFTLSHSEDRDNIVITIWYWAEDEIKPMDLKKAAAQAARTGRPTDATGKPTGSPDLPLSLSGGFAGLGNLGEVSSEESLGRTPSIDRPPMDESKP